MLDFRGYFNAERAESVIFVVIAFAVTMLSLYLMYKHRSSFVYGLASALITVATIQAVVGTIVFIRSPLDITRVETALKKSNQEVIKQEIPRMEAVMKNFRTYSNVELFLMILGVLLMFFTSKHSFYAGIGVGLLTQSTLMLLLDFFAEKRGEVYLEALRNLNSI